jgi:DNA polymerase-3 subunit beta
MTSGVLVRMSEEHLTFATADSFRLAIRTVSLPEGSEARPDILIPARTLMELARILPADGPVEMLVTPQRSQMLFHTPTLDLMTGLIEGTFPDYRRIIPNDYTTRVVVETSTLAQSIKAAALFARESANAASLKVATGEINTLTVEARTDETGENVSVLEASVEGPAMTLVFNVCYLADVLAVIDTPGRPGIRVSIQASRAQTCWTPGIPLRCHAHAYQQIKEKRVYDLVHHSCPGAWHCARYLSDLRLVS